MKYCKRCLQPNTRPGIKFDKNGVCFACKYEESKAKIDWYARFKELMDIANWAKEWSQVYNADFSIARGMRGRTEENLYDIGRYRRYSALDSDLQIVNQMIKYLKFGFGHATDYACYDIREGRLTREDTKWYIKEYDGSCGEQYIDMVYKYMSITKEKFWSVVDKYVNKDLFEKKDGKWTPKFEVGVDYNE